MSLIYGVVCVGAGFALGVVAGPGWECVKGRWEVWWNARPVAAQSLAWAPEFGGEDDDAGPSHVGDVTEGETRTQWRYHVFLSHGYDKVLPQLLYNELFSRGLKVFFDRETAPGHCFESGPSSVAAIVADSHVAVVFVNKFLIASRWAMAEVEAALREYDATNVVRVYPVFFDTEMSVEQLRTWRSEWTRKKHLPDAVHPMVEYANSAFRKGSEPKKKWEYGRSTEYSAWLATRNGYAEVVERLMTFGARFASPHTDRVHRVISDIADSTVRMLEAVCPTLPTTNSGVGGLPPPVPELHVVERTLELSQLADAVASHSLVEVTGAHGSGKTTLAVALVHSAPLQGLATCVVWWDFEDSMDRTDVLFYILTTGLGLVVADGTPLPILKTTLRAELRARAAKDARVVFVLDGVDSQVDAGLVDVLAHAVFSPHVLLVTSVDPVLDAHVLTTTVSIGAMTETEAAHAVAFSFDGTSEGPSRDQGQAARVATFALGHPGLAVYLAARARKVGSLDGINCCSHIDDAWASSGLGIAACVEKALVGIPPRWESLLLLLAANSHLPFVSATIALSIVAFFVTPLTTNAGSTILDVLTSRGLLQVRLVAGGNVKALSMGKHTARYLAERLEDRALLVLRVAVMAAHAPTDLGLSAQSGTTECGKDVIRNAFDKAHGTWKEEGVAELAVAAGNVILNRPSLFGSGTDSRMWVLHPVTLDSLNALVFPIIDPILERGRGQELPEGTLTVANRAITALSAVYQAQATLEGPGTDIGDAKQFYTRAIAFLTDVDADSRTRETARTLTNFAALLLLNKVGADLGQAILLARQALDLKVSLGESADVCASSANILASILKEGKDYAGAIEVYKDAVARFDPAEETNMSSVHRATLLTNWGRTLFHSLNGKEEPNQRREAIPVLTLAVEAHEASHNPSPELIDCLEMLNQAYRKEGQITEALACNTRALHVQNTLAPNGSGKALQIRANFIPLYLDLADRLGPSDQGNQALERAQDILDHVAPHFSHSMLEINRRRLSDLRQSWTQL